MSPYPRYLAGAIWTHSPHTEVLYQTIDGVRESFESALAIWSTCDMVILIAGMIVPGKYIGGTPISVREARELFSSILLADSLKVLVGPWARFGCGLEGGKLALSAERLSPPFDYIIDGDPEVVIGGLAGNQSLYAAGTNAQVGNRLDPVSRLGRICHRRLHRPAGSSSSLSCPVMNLSARAARHNILPQKGGEVFLRSG